MMAAKKKAKNATARKANGAKVAPKMAKAVKAAKTAKAAKAAQATKLTKTKTTNTILSVTKSSSAEQHDVDAIVNDTKSTPKPTTNNSANTSNTTGTNDDADVLDKSATGSNPIAVGVDSSSDDGEIEEGELFEDDEVGEASKESSEEARVEEGSLVQERARLQKERLSRMASSTGQTQSRRHGRSRLFGSDDETSKYEELLHGQLRKRSSTLKKEKREREQRRPRNRTPPAQPISYDSTPKFPMDDFQDSYLPKMVGPHGIVQSQFRPPPQQHSRPPFVLSNQPIQRSSSGQRPFAGGGPTFIQQGGNRHPPPSFRTPDRYTEGFDIRGGVEVGNEEPMRVPAGYEDILMPGLSRNRRSNDHMKSVKEGTPRASRPTFFRNSKSTSSGKHNSAPRNIDDHDNYEYKARLPLHRQHELNSEEELNYFPEYSADVQVDRHASFKVENGFSSRDDSFFGNPVFEEASSSQYIRRSRSPSPLRQAMVSAPIVDSTEMSVSAPDLSSVYKTATTDDLLSQDINEPEDMELSSGDEMHTSMHAHRISAGSGYGYAGNELLQPRVLSSSNINTIAPSTSVTPHLANANAPPQKSKPSTSSASTLAALREMALSQTAARKAAKVREANAAEAQVEGATSLHTKAQTEHKLQKLAQEQINSISLPSPKVPSSQYNPSAPNSNDNASGRGAAFLSRFLRKTQRETQQQAQQQHVQEQAQQETQLQSGGFAQHRGGRLDEKRILPLYPRFLDFPSVVCPDDTDSEDESTVHRISSVFKKSERHSDINSQSNNNSASKTRASGDGYLEQLKRMIALRERDNLNRRNNNNSGMKNKASEISALTPSSSPNPMTPNLENLPTTSHVESTHTGVKRTIDAVEMSSTIPVTDSIDDGDTYENIRLNVQKKLAADVDALRETVQTQERTMVVYQRNISDQKDKLRTARRETMELSTLCLKQNKRLKELRKMMSELEMALNENMTKHETKKQAVVRGEKTMLVRNSEAKTLEIELLQNRILLIQTLKQHRRTQKDTMVQQETMPNAKAVSNPASPSSPVEIACEQADEVKELERKVRLALGASNSTPFSKVEDDDASRPTYGSEGKVTQSDSDATQVEIKTAPSPASNTSQMMHNARVRQAAKEDIVHGPTFKEALGPANEWIIDALRTQQKRGQQQLHEDEAESDESGTDIDEIRTGKDEVPVLSVKKSLTPGVTRSSGGLAPTFREDKFIIDVAGDYISPLRSLKSYRFVPFYRTKAKLPLSSKSYSHKIDPMKTMCKFEISGSCRNPNCRNQHIKDYTFSNEELLKDIASYALDATGASTDARMKSLTAKYSMLSNEQLQLMLLSEVIKGRKNTFADGPSYVSTKARGWTPTNDQGNSSLPTHLNPREVNVDGLETRIEGAKGVVKVGHDLKNVGGDCNKGGRENKNIEVRYYDDRLVGAKRDFESRVKESPHDTSLWIEFARDAATTELARGDEEGSTLDDVEIEEREQKSLDLSLHILSRALESNRTSETLWIEYLTLYEQRMDDEEEVKEVYEDAVRLVPWSFTLWWRLIHFGQTQSQVYKCTVRAYEAMAQCMHSKQAESEQECHVDGKVKVATECATVGEDMSLSENENENGNVNDDGDESESDKDDDDELMGSSDGEEEDETSSSGENKVSLSSKRKKDMTESEGSNDDDDDETIGEQDDNKIDATNEQLEERLLRFAVYSIHLDLYTGRKATAIEKCKSMVSTVAEEVDVTTGGGAAQENSASSSNKVSFSGLARRLKPANLARLWITYIHVVAFHCVPVSLYVDNSAVDLPDPLGEKTIDWSRLGVEELHASFAQLMDLYENAMRMMRSESSTPPVITQETSNADYVKHVYLSAIWLNIAMSRAEDKRLTSSSDENCQANDAEKYDTLALYQACRDIVSDMVDVLGNENAVSVVEGKSNVHSTALRMHIQLCEEFNDTATLSQHVLSVVESGCLLCTESPSEDSGAKTELINDSNARLSLEELPSVLLSYIRLELKAERVEHAFELLSICARTHFNIAVNVPLTSSVDENGICVNAGVLYCSLLGLPIPYNNKIPTLKPATVKESSLSKRRQNAALWQCYCLYVNLTSNHASLSSSLRSAAVSSDGFATEDETENAYDLALVSLKSGAATREIWVDFIEYLCDVQQRVDDDPDPSKLSPMQRKIQDAINRCRDRNPAPSIEAFGMTIAASYSHACGIGKTKDYRFTSMLLDFLFRCIPERGWGLVFESALRVEYDNPSLAIKAAYYQYSIGSVQKVDNILGRLVRACPSFFVAWKMAISLEIHQKKYLEARWLYSAGVGALPLCSQLWKDYIDFEACHGTDSTSSIKDVFKAAASRQVVALEPSA
eukprot:CFRG3460T1